MILRSAIALTLLIAAGPASADELVVQLDNLRSAKGNVVVCIWGNGEAFPDCDAGKPVARRTIAASEAGTPIVFKDIAPGTIAISVFHDENANGRFDTNFVRMPLEGVGLSNNPKMAFGPPKFKNSTFTPKPGAPVRVKMTYL